MVAWAWQIPQSPQFDQSRTVPDISKIREKSTQVYLLREPKTLKRRKKEAVEGNCKQREIVMHISFYAHFLF